MSDGFVSDEDVTGLVELLLDACLNTDDWQVAITADHDPDAHKITLTIHYAPNDDQA